jgi:hypothetical protein
MVATVSDEDPLAGREQVLQVLEEIQSELVSGAEWENNTLERFLDAFAALLGSMENSYANTGRPVPDDPWVIVAEAFRGARQYE